MSLLPARTDIEDTQSLAQLMIKSRMFSDIQDVAQGAVRILAGRELGIGPVASLRGIEIVRGNLSIRSQLMAAMIKRSPQYNYRVRESTETKCTIEFTENGEVCGTSEFTIDDAKRANLTGNDSWKRYPKIMLYNRAMSQGAKMFCPDIFLGGVFYESEIIEGEASVVTEPAQPPQVEMASEKQVSFLLGLLKKVGVRDGDKRELIELAYPDGMPKAQAHDAIEGLQEGVGMPIPMKRAYVRMLVQKLGLDRQAVANHMDDNYGHHNPANLSETDYGQLVDYLYTKVNKNVTPSEPDDIYLPGELDKNPSLQDWVKLTVDTCMEGKFTDIQFKSWVLNHFSKEDINDISKLPPECYSELKSMGSNAIIEQVKSFLSERELQGALV